MLIIPVLTGLSVLLGDQVSPGGILVQSLVAWDQLPLLLLIASENIKGEVRLSTVTWNMLHQSSKEMHHRLSQGFI